MAKASKPSRLNAMQYHLDLYLSSGPMARFVCLFVLTFALIITCTLMIFAFGGSGDGTILESLWWSTMRVLDPGTMAGDEGTMTRLVAFIATFSGILVAALLIGLVSTTVNERLEDLRKGKSRVIDEGHTLIIGFSDKIFAMIREIIIANENQKGASIVVLSHRDKELVETALQQRITDWKTTRVVVRQGSAFSPSDLEKVAAGEAKSIVIISSDLSEAGEEDANALSSDLNAIKTVLALRQVPGALVDNYAVVELEDEQQSEVVKRLGNVEVVAMRDTLARLMVQTARQKGLAQVYRSLLTFDGAEFYVAGFPQFAGRKFSEVHDHMAGGVVVGVKQDRVLINPTADSVLDDKTQLIVLAEDDDTFGYAEQPVSQGAQSLPLPAQTVSLEPEKILICGFRTDLNRLIGYLDDYLRPGSLVRLVLSPEDVKRYDHEELNLENGSFELIEAEVTDPSSISGITKDDYDSIMLLANDTLTPEVSDAKTVISLLLLRDATRHMPKPPKIISEILDPKTKDLISVDAHTDFVVSSEITSMLLAQISEQRDSKELYDELFDADGSEIYLKPILRYIPLNQTVSWRTLQLQAEQRGELAFGCFRDGAPPLLNPPANMQLHLAPTDCLIVMAEDELDGTETIKSADQFAEDSPGFGSNVITKIPKTPTDKAS